MRKIPQFTTYLLVAGLMAGCNGVDFRTNVGPYAKSRIASAGVREYSPVEIGRYDAVSLGFVDSSACQDRIDAPEPERSDLVRKMKQRVHDMGGNGIVVESCGKAALGTCRVHLECRGMAYSVPERQSRP
ncbi:hypothetical protein [Microbulbifer sp. M83]|uniref:hypothetical protein n=1 Tax=Microbulbifer sp. M83 TaxID=3118246 RepID=UPI002FE42A42